MQQIKIGGVTHPLYFSMLSIEQVFSDLQVEDFAKLGAVMSTKTAGNSLKFGRACAFAGIAGGYRKQGEKCPFVSADALGDEVISFAELEPAIIGFTKAVEEFFKPADDVAPVEGK
jgi:hypothetical protein